MFQASNQSYNQSRSDVLMFLDSSSGKQLSPAFNGNQITITEYDPRDQPSKHDTVRVRKVHGNQVNTSKHDSSNSRETSRSVPLKDRDVACVLHANGACREGENCRFSHEEELTRKLNSKYTVLGPRIYHFTNPWSDQTARIQT